LLGVVVGGHQPGGLVIAEHPRRLRGVDHLAVDGQDVVGADLDGGGGQDLAVQGDPAVLDQPLDRAPRGDARPGQHLGDPRAVSVVVLTRNGVVMQVGLVFLGHGVGPSRAGRISRWAVF
jgi:hypothetical protein